VDVAGSAAVVAMAADGRLSIVTASHIVSAAPGVMGLDVAGAAVVVGMGV
jgi:hypothetical protein